MIDPIVVQALHFLYAIGAGCGLGAVYLVTHILPGMTVLKDLAFCLLSVAAALAFFLTVCDGLVRGYVLVGMIAGMLCMIRLCEAGIQRRKNGQNPSKSKSKKA